MRSSDVCCGVGRDGDGKGVGVHPGDHVVLSVQDQVPALNRGWVAGVGNGWVEVDLFKHVRLDLLPSLPGPLPTGEAPRGLRSGSQREVDG